jgi:hypothetical protein
LLTRRNACNIEVNNNLTQHCLIVLAAMLRCAVLCFVHAVPNVLQYLQPAKPLVTSNPEFGYCLEPASRQSSNVTAAVLATVVNCATLKNPAAFYFQPSTKQIVMNATKMCLTASTNSGEVLIAPCAKAAVPATEELKQQSWAWIGGKHLKTVQGACLRLHNGAVKLGDCGSNEEAVWAFGSGALLFGHVSLL